MYIFKLVILITYWYRGGVMTMLSSQVHAHKMNRKSTYTLSVELGS